MDKKRVGTRDFTRRRVGDKKNKKARCETASFLDGGGARIRTLEGESQQIYSLSKVNCGRWQNVHFSRINKGRNAFQQGGGIYFYLLVFPAIRNTKDVRKMSAERGARL